MADELPPFASTTAEIRLAVEQNAIDRGTLFFDVIVSLNIDGMLRELEQLAFTTTRRSGEKARRRLAYARMRLISWTEEIRRSRMSTTFLHLNCLPLIPI